MRRIVKSRMVHYTRKQKEELVAQLKIEVCPPRCPVTASSRSAPPFFDTRVSLFIPLHPPFLASLIPASLSFLPPLHPLFPPSDSIDPSLNSLSSCLPPQLRPWPSLPRNITSKLTLSVYISLSLSLSLPPSLSLSTGVSELEEAAADFQQGGRWQERKAQND